MKNQPIARIMTPAPASVAPTSRVAAAERLMRERHCHHVPVVAEGRVVGLIGAHDLLKSLLLLPEQDDGALKQASLENRRVSEIMRHKVAVLPQTATLLDAAQALAKGNVHALPVVAPGDVLVGIVTSTDLIEALIDSLKYPVDEGVGGASREEPQVSSLQLRRLREVYRATLYYLESGRGELEHGRLLQAVNRARELMTPEDVPI